MNEGRKAVQQRRQSPGAAAEGSVGRAYGLSQEPVCAADGCGVDSRPGSEMLVDHQSPENTPQQGHLKDGLGQGRRAETPHSWWSPTALSPPHRGGAQRPSELPAALGQASAAWQHLPHRQPRGTTVVGPAGWAAAPAPHPPALSLLSHSYSSL